MVQTRKREDRICGLWKEKGSKAAAKPYQLIPLPKTVSEGGAVMEAMGNHLTNK